MAPKITQQYENMDFVETEESKAGNTMIPADPFSVGQDTLKKDPLNSRISNEDLKSLDMSRQEFEALPVKVKERLIRSLMPFKTKEENKEMEQLDKEKPEPVNLPSHLMQSNKDPEKEFEKLNKNLPPVIETENYTPISELRYNESTDGGGKLKAPAISRYDNFERIELPSHFLPYEHNDLLIRPLNIKDIGTLYKATQSGSFSILVDVIGNCIKSNLDVRDLTMGDFRYLMYWLRLNSYNSSPFEFPWVSRYGNKNIHVVKQSNLDIIEIKMSETEYEEYTSSYDIRIPTIRDTEITMGDDVSDEDEFLLMRAQYLREGKTPQEKVDLLQTMGIDVLEAIRQFNEKTTHGINESVSVIDTNFIPSKAVSYLRKEAEKLAREINVTNLSQVDPQIYQQAMEQYDGMIAEAEEIESLLNKRKELKDRGLDPSVVSIQPKEEKIDISINLTRFFPNI